MISPIELVDYVEDTNLRELTWSQHKLEQIQREHKLKHGQAVVFANTAQDRFRLVACFFGLAVLILPPIDPAERHSLYLKVNAFLRRLKGSADVGQALKHSADVAKRRIEAAERKALAESAAAKRQAAEQ